MIYGLDLFSGIGGLSMALNEWVRPIAYCEIDLYCQAVLISGMERFKLHNAPIWDDIRTLEASDLPQPIDIIYGGFPCQDISIAGNGKGLEGERSGLFFEIMRLAKEIKPSFIFLENVPAITSRGGLRVIREVAEMGYDCRWCVISAASVGAPHKRERWFLLAHTYNNGSLASENRRSFRECLAQGKESKQQKESIGEAERTSSLPENVAHSSSQQGRRICKFKSQPHTFNGDNGRGKANWWKIEPDVGRVVDGIPHRVDRLKALGNAVVPQQAKKAFETLMGIKNNLVSY